MRFLLELDNLKKHYALTGGFSEERSVLSKRLTVFRYL